MKIVVDQLKKQLQNSCETTYDCLIKELTPLIASDITWVSHYPTALVHDKKALSQIEDLKALQKQLPSQEIRTMDLVALSSQPSTLTFSAKRPHDFWKRLLTADHIEALVALLCVPSSACSDDFIAEDLKSSDKKQWSVETQLRDAMRANKENRDLGAKPLIIIMCKERIEEREDHLKLMLEHYFGNDLEVIVSKDGKSNYYLAYHDQMGKIGMRYFYKFAT
jgi:hypothetical protein